MGEGRGGVTPENLDRGGDTGETVNCDLHSIGVQVWVNPVSTEPPWIAMGVVIPGRRREGIIIWQGEGQSSETLAEFHRVLDVCYTLSAFLNSGGHPDELRGVVEAIMLSVGAALCGLTSLVDYEVPHKRSYSVADDTSIYHVLPNETFVEHIPTTGLGYIP